VEANFNSNSFKMLTEFINLSDEVAFNQN